MKPTKAQLAKIHIAKKELQLTDDIYRDILAVNFKVESAKDLTDRQAVQLLEIFRVKGWQAKSKKSGTGQKKRSSNYIVIKPGPTAAQQRKVLAMWNELGYAMEKLHSRCQRQFNVDRFEWLTDRDALHVLITDLDQRIKSTKDI
jgi:phage gp16-like protein